MALIEMFQDAREPQPLLNVLNQGLAAAEGTSPALWSGSDDLCYQFVHEGKLEPDWLDHVNPELAAIYRNWLEQNKPRVLAVLNKLA